MAKYRVLLRCSQRRPPQVPCLENVSGNGPTYEGAMRSVFLHVESPQHGLTEGKNRVASFTQMSKLTGIISELRIWSSRFVYQENTTVPSVRGVRAWTLLIRKLLWIAQIDLGDLAVAQGGKQIHSGQIC